MVSKLFTMHGVCKLWWTQPSSRHHNTSLLRQLHWLKVPWRIDYKLAVLVYKCLHGLAPSYLADELHHTAESQFRRRLRSASSHESRTVCSPYPTLILRRPSISSRRCTDLEQSSAAYHICSVTSRLLLSLEDILLQTLSTWLDLTPVITVVVPAKWHCHGHVNRSDLLSYGGVRNINWRTDRCCFAARHTWLWGFVCPSRNMVWYTQCSSRKWKGKGTPSGEGARI